MNLTDDNTDKKQIDKQHADDDYHAKLANICEFY